MTALSVGFRPKTQVVNWLFLETGSSSFRKPGAWNGVVYPYAAGLFINQVLGWTTISHSGTTASYCAYLEAFPELDLSIAIISNTSLFSVYDVKSAMDSLFVRDKNKPSNAVETSVQLTPTTLAALTGLYALERDGLTFQLALKDSQLVMDNRLSLVPVSNNVIKSANFRLLFYGSKGLYIRPASADTIPFRKVQPVSLSQKELLAYTGNYFSEETNSSLWIYLEAGKLVVRLKANEIYPLLPTYRDAFTIDELGNVLFLRGPHKQLTGLQFNTDRARKVSFEKVANSGPNNRLPVSSHQAILSK